MGGSPGLVPGQPPAHGDAPLVCRGHPATGGPTHARRGGTGPQAQSHAAGTLPLSEEGLRAPLPGSQKQPSALLSQERACLTPSRQRGSVVCVAPSAGRGCPPPGGCRSWPQHRRRWRRRCRTRGKAPPAGRRRRRRSGSTRGGPGRRARCRRPGAWDSAGGGGESAQGGAGGCSSSPLAHRAAAQVVHAGREGVTERYRYVKLYLHRGRGGPDAGRRGRLVTSAIGTCLSPWSARSSAAP